jgi:hypothetical protein
MQTFENWINSIECTNIPVNRCTNRAVYKLPIIGLELIENEYIPYNVFLKPKFYTWLGGLIIENSVDNTELLKKYNGILVEEFYSENLYFCQFDTLENAYSFVKNEYQKIVDTFRGSCQVF